MVIRTRTPAEFLSETQKTIRAGDVDEGLARLVGWLRETRASSSRERWRQQIERFAQHPLREMLYQDPMTRRCYDKPRGYPGDAVMLDLIYGLRPVPARTTPLGREIFQRNFASSICDSVRARRLLVGELIDRLARGRETLSVLSITCGHVREAQSSRAVREGRVDRYVGVDQDPLSLSVVERELAPLGVRPVEGTVKRILRGELPLGTFDLVYAVGLYNYLLQPVAVALTARLFHMLQPGGTLLIPNCTPDVREVGYLEAFMDWHMIYRDEARLDEVASGIDPARIADKRLYRDANGNVAFLEVQRG